MSNAGRIRALVVAPDTAARKGIREALEANPDVEVAGDAGDLRDAALEAARLHPDLVVVAVSHTDEDTGWALPQLLGVAPGAKVVLTLLEEWSPHRPADAKGYDLREIVDVLREARAADARDHDPARREATLSMLAHDIMTPVTAMIGVADLLLRYWDRMDEPQLRDGVKNISEVGRDLAALVKGIIRAAAADAGSLVGDREPVDVRTMLTECAEGISRISPEHRVDVDIEKGVPKVWVDRDRVQEAVLNFLSNAVKFSPTGTRIGVTARATEAEVSITVTDEGPGVPEADRHRLFRKFSRLHPEDTPGHGLGLYLVKAIVEAHGGRVWVGEGEGGRGATFGLALPATGRTRGGRGSRAGAR